MNLKNTTQSILKNIKNFLIHLSHSARRIGNHILMSLRIFSRSPGTIFLLIIYPIILLLLFGSIFATQTDFSYPLQIQDRDGTSFSQGLIVELENNQYLSVSRLSNDIIPRDYLEENNLDACLIIPENWTINRYNIDLSPSNVTLIINPSSYSGKRIIEIVSSTIKNYDIEDSPEDPIVNIDASNFYSDALSYIDFFIPGIIGVIILNTGILGTINRQIHFKNSGLFRKLATTPTTRWEYAIAELIWQFLIAIVSTIIAMFTGWIAFGFSWLAFDGLIFIIVIAGVMTFSGIGLLISQLIRSSKSALAIGTLITIPVIFLSRVFFDISGIKSLVVISYFSPLTYIVEALRASMITKNWFYAWENIGISIAIGVVALVLGVILTKWEKD